MGRSDGVIFWEKLEDGSFGWDSLVVVRIVRIFFGFLRIVRGRWKGVEN